MGISGLGGVNGALVSAFLIGGMANPLYGILLAYTNDYLEYEDMSAASGRLLFVNGLGAVGGPLITGWLMGVAGPAGFFIFVGVLMLVLAVYAGWRMTQRGAQPIGDDTNYVVMSPMATTPVTIESVVEEWEDQAPEVGTDTMAVNP